MRSFGLTLIDLRNIKDLLNKYFGDIPDAKVYLFGSRVKGNHKKYSDIDLAIRTKSQDLSKRLSVFKEEWEQSKIPYKIDITS
jgi:predicted nucleotidyltransferase